MNQQTHPPSSRTFYRVNGVLIPAENAVSAKRVAKIYAGNVRFGPTSQRKAVLETDPNVEALFAAQQIKENARVAEARRQADKTNERVELLEQMLRDVATKGSPTPNGHWIVDGNLIGRARTLLNTP